MSQLHEVIFITQFHKTRYYLEEKWLSDLMVVSYKMMDMAVKSYIPRPSKIKLP